jgi:subtilisin family serine protease
MAKRLVDYQRVLLAKDGYIVTGSNVPLKIGEPTVDPNGAALVISEATDRDDAIQQVAYLKTYFSDLDEMINHDEPPLNYRYYRTVPKEDA